MADLLQTKIGSLFVIFTLALLSGLLPIKLRSYLFNNSKIQEKYSLIILSASLCCGAGVLMATVFLHILKETREGFENAIRQGAMPETDYSLAELLICSGFFFIYLLEELVHYCVKHKHTYHDKEEDYCEITRVSSLPMRSSQRRLRFSESQENSVNGSVPNESNNIITVIGNMMPPNEITFTNRKQSAPEVKVPMQIRNETKTAEESLVRSFIIIIALSIHGAFEGLSVGLEDSINNVWLLCMALSAHKVFIAFSIGMEMLEEGVNRVLYLFQMLVFALASPIGGTIGLTLTTSLSDTESGIIVITVIKGISGGTILYVTFCEVLERERMKTSGRFIRLFALIAGFCILAGLQAISVEHEHFDNHLLNDTDIGDEHHDHYP